MVDAGVAHQLLLWCNSPSCGQSPRVIKRLLDVGYPPQKLKHYRGGMQMWQPWGLTTVIPEGRGRGLLLAVPAVFTHYRIEVSWYVAGFGSPGIEGDGY
jgi:hypothetical protein